MKHLRYFFPHLYSRLCRVILLLVTAVPGFSQGGTRVTATTDKTSILIGEQIRLTLTADIPENEPIDFFQLDSLPHLEVVKAEKIDTNNTSKGTLLTQVVYLTSFDSGHWAIPPLLLHDSIFTDSIPVDIGHLPLDPLKPYNDVKDILEADGPKSTGDRYWWLIGLGVALLAMAAWWLFRKKTRVVLADKPPVDAYQQAMEDIAALRLGRADKPLFYEGLVNVFRIYLDKRRNIHSLQQTTAELSGQLKTLTLPATLYDRLTQSLRLGDLVKFARFESDDTEDQETLNAIREAIELVEQQYQRELRASGEAEATSASASGTSSANTKKPR